MFGRADPKIYDKMDLFIRMRILCNVRYRHSICLKFGDTFLTPLTKLALEVKAIICFSAKFVIVVIT